MFLLVFVLLLGTVATVNDAPPEVKMFAEVVDVGTETGRHRMLTCLATGFNTSDVVLNIKKNRFVRSIGDGVKTEGVKPDQDKTYQKRDHVIVPHSEVSNHSCEVVHAASRFRVEKGWDPKSGSKGRIISSKFIDTTPPHVETFTTNSTDHTKVFLTCLVSGFYPYNITVIIWRNRTILTREDGVVTADVRPNEDDTFQRRDSVEIKKIDKSHYSCEVIHAASGSRVEMFWDQPEVEMFAEVVDVGAETGHHMVLTCRVSGFNTSDIILNIKKNHCVLTKEDGVKTSGVKLDVDNIYQREDRVNVSRSEVSNYSCEVVHASSRFRVEKVWDPESGGKGRIISSEFIETNHSLTQSAGAGDNRDKTGVITGAVAGGVLVLVLVLVVLVVLWRRCVRGAAKNKTINSSDLTDVVADPPPGGDVNIPLMNGTKGSKTSLNSFDSGVAGSQPGDSGSDADSRGSLSGFSTSSAVAASIAPVPGSPDSGSIAESPERKLTRERLKSPEIVHEKHQIHQSHTEL